MEHGLICPYTKQNVLNGRRLVEGNCPAQNRLYKCSLWKNDKASSCVLCSENFLEVGRGVSQDVRLQLYAAVFVSKDRLSLLTSNQQRSTSYRGSALKSLNIVLCEEVLDRPLSWLESIKEQIEWEEV